MALYHIVKGSVNYTVVGSPTIVDGVASGFANKSYIRTNAYLTTTADAISQEDLELCCDFIAGNSTGDQCLLKYQTYLTSASSESAAQGISGLLVHNGVLRYKIATRPIDSTSDFYVNSSVTLVEGQRYIAKGTFVGDNTYAISVSSDGGSTWTTDTGTRTWTPERLSVNRYCAVGQADRTGSWQYPFTGSINLNHTYIKVNGQPWFGVCPVEVKHINRNSSTVNYVIKGGKLVFADKGLYLTGPVNYTVVGSPTIVDGVASGFSDNDYLQTSSTLDLTTNLTDLWEFQVKFTTGDDITTSSRCIYNGGSFYKGFIQSGNQKIRVLLRKYNPDSDSWSWLFIDLDYAVSTNTTYVLNVQQQTIESFVIKLYNSEGSLLTTEQKEGYFSFVNTDSRVFYGRKGNESPISWNGSIDLKETYIKVNGSLWFYGKNYASQNIAPVPSGYTYGTTTTSAIGFVDMRTQVFTAAPSGATIGRDE